jgi:HAD superfamily hydrolase (TIGR01459 family)
VLCTGLRQDEIETPADYEPELRSIAARSLVMICANPDVVIHRGETLVYCAGALAGRYEELGGPVVYAGKPHAPIYERALTLAERARGAATDKSRVLAIGDGMKTDIAGAARAGLDALFVTGGIHRSVHGEAPASAADPVELRELYEDYGLWPIAAIPTLQP